MASADGTEPVKDEELLFRRIPASTGWYDPNETPGLSLNAFKPGKHDSTGISLYRDKYKGIQEAAKGRPGKSYFVAVLRAGDLRSRGIDVVPRPEEGDPGHVEIAGLNYADAKSNQALEWKVLLAHELTTRVEGPFKDEDSPTSND